MRIVSVDEGFVDLDARDTMYPTYGFLLKDDEAVIGNPEFRWSTLYGFSDGYTTLAVNGTEIRLQPKEYVCYPMGEYSLSLVAKGTFFGVLRLGFSGQFIIGEVEKRGRLCYIDGCSDSLLVYPPRQGDPSLNSLHFPPAINQSFHTHPSIRMGYVADGEGYACFGYDPAKMYHADRSIHEPLKKGSAFLLSEQELHRFKTDDSGMTVIAFHPDGDWGPTDQNHTMLNRTYIK